jgi:apolipoprotein N-acyltransferase
MIKKRVKKFLEKEDYITTIIFILIFFLWTHGFDELVWVGIATFILLAHNKPLKKAALLATLAISIAAGISFTWVIKYNLFTFIASYLLYIAFYIIFAILFNILSKRIKGYPAIFVAPFLWSILQLIFSYGPTKSYWTDYAMYNSMNAPLIWFLGSNGITFLVILMNSIIALYFIKKDKRILATGVALALIFLVTYAYSYNAKPEGEKLKVALVKGNFNQPWEWRRINAKTIIFDTYKNLSFEASKKNAELIIWPEYAIAEDISKDRAGNKVK